MELLCHHTKLLFRLNNNMNILYINLDKNVDTEKQNN